MTIKKIVFALFFLNITLINSSYSQKYNAIDSIILKYPNFGSTEKLAARIQKDFASEHDKARAIYSWITQNINYDWDAYLNPPAIKSFSYKDEAEKNKKIQVLNQKTFQKTFRSNKAVCEGFSLLYAHLAELAGLRCQVITGDAKIKVNDIGRRNIVTNHAWNTVQIDGKWILIDATWGQGYYDISREVIVKKFTPIYFDMDPKYFFTKHYPDSGIFADYKMNKTDYLNAPLFYNKAFEDDYEIVSPDSGIIKANEGDKIIFKIKNIAKFEDVYYLDKKKKPVKVKNIKEENGILEFEIIYSKKMGRYITFYIYRNAFVSFKVIPK